MWFEAYAQKEHSCGSSLQWPTWKTGLALTSEELYAFVGTWGLPVFLAMASFSAMTKLDLTKHSRLRSCHKISVGKHWTVSPTVWIWHPAIFSCFLPWRSTCHDIFSPAMSLRMWCLHTSDTTFCASGMDRLATCWDWGLNHQGDFVEL
jgi:hypothetical protein